jgi:hypothetical protein
LNDAPAPRKTSALSWLEPVTGVVILLVLAALAWMVAAAYAPELSSWAAPDVQVILVLALLTAALFLVSIVALLHTR